MSAVWLVMTGVDEGGWVIQGVFSTRRKALQYVSTLRWEAFVASRVLDEHESWDDAHAANPSEGIVPVSRGDLLAEGLDLDAA